jgi:hypothetical protein
MVRLMSAAAFVLAANGLAACAVEPVPAAPSAWRIAVKLRQPSTDRQNIVDTARRIAGVDIDYVAATSPQWHALGLRCAEEAACDAALQRLRAATATYESVQRDQRRQPLVSP